MDWDNYEPTSDEHKGNTGGLENGIYDVLINRAQEKPTKAGTGSYIDLEMQVLSGPRQNSRIWPKLNIENKNETAQKIGRAQFRDLLLAIGHQGKIKPDAGGGFPDMINKKCRIRVRVKQNSEFGPQSEVVKYMKIDDSEPATTKQTSVAGSGGTPW